MIAKFLKMMNLVLVSGSICLAFFIKENLGMSRHKVNANVM